MADRTSTVTVNFVTKLAQGKLKKTQNKILSATKNIQKSLQNVSMDKSIQSVKKLESRLEKLRNSAKNASGLTVGEFAKINTQIQQTEQQLQKANAQLERMQRSGGSAFSSPLKRITGSGGERLIDPTQGGQIVRGGAIPFDPPTEGVQALNKAMSPLNNRMFETREQLKSVGMAMDGMFDKGFISRADRMTESLHTQNKMLSQNVRKVSGLGKTTQNAGQAMQTAFSDQQIQRVRGLTKAADDFGIGLKEASDKGLHQFSQTEQKVRNLNKQAKQVGPAMSAMFDRSFIRRANQSTESLNQFWQNLSFSEKIMHDFNRVMRGGLDKIVEFGKGLGDALANINPFSESTRQSSNATRQFAQSLGQASLQLFGFIALIRIFTGLQDKIRQGFEDLSEAVSESERTYSTFNEVVESSNQALDAGIDLAHRFGLDVSESMHAIRRSMSGVPKELEDLATAQEMAAKAAQMQLLANTELDDSVQLISRAFTVFSDTGMSAEQQLERVKEVADTVAVAVRTAGEATVEDFAEQLPDVIGIAETFNFTLEETVAAVSAVEKVLPMSQATTDLRRNLRLIAQESDVLNEAASRFGIAERFDFASMAAQDLNRTAKGLNKTLQSQGAIQAGIVSENANWLEVQEALENVDLSTLEQNVELTDDMRQNLENASPAAVATAAGLNELLGSSRRSLRPVLALTGQLEEFDSVLNAVEDSEGFLDDFETRFFEQPMNRLNQLLGRIEVQFFQLAKGIGGTFLPILNSVLPVLDQMLAGFSKAFIALAGFTQPIRLVREGLESLIDVIPGAEKALKFLAQTAGFVFGTVATVILGVAIGTLPIFQNAISKTATIFGRATDKILMWAGQQVTAIELIQAAQSKALVLWKANTASFIATWKGWGQAVKRITLGTGASMNSNMTGMFGVIQKAFQGFTSATVGIMKGFGKKIGVIVRAIGSKMSFLLGPWGLVIAGIIAGIVLLEKKFGFLSKAWEKTKNFLLKHSQAILKGLTAMVDFIWNGVLLRWLKLQAWQADQLLKVLGFLLDETAGVFGAIWSVARKFLDNIFEFGQSIGSAIEDIIFAFRKFGFKSKKSWKTVALAVSKIVISWVKYMIKTIRDGMDGIQFVIVKALESFININIKSWQFIIDTVIKAGNWLIDIVKNTWNSITSFLGNIWSKTLDKAAQFAKHLVNAIMNPIDTVKKLATGAWDTIVGGIKDFFDDSEQAAIEGSDQLQDGFELSFSGIASVVLDNLTDMAGRTATTIRTILDPSKTFEDLEDFRNRGTAIGNALFTPLVDVLDGMESTVEERMDNLLGDRPQKVDQIMESIRQKLPTEEDITGFINAFAQKLKGSPLQDLVGRLELSSGQIEHVLRQIAAFMGVAGEAADEQEDAAEEQQETVAALKDVADQLDEKDINQQITLSPQVFVTVEEDMDAEDFRRQFVPQINKELQRQLKDLGLLSDTNIKSA